jgi:sulfur relay (sulfurtransferase) complex TusBCD TusD component (DsrE family)
MAGFEPALRLVETALGRDLEVFVYCLDDGIMGLEEPRLKAVQDRGARVYGCAYAAERRGRVLRPEFAYGGLALLSDVIAASDRFVCFG